MPQEETSHSTNGWGEWSKHVLLELKRLNNCVTILDTKVDNLTKEFVILKTEFQMKARTQGAIFGSIASIVVGVITALITISITKGSP